jgi:hypothetical protein
MKPANAGILTINGCLSSIKFAVFEAGDSLRRIPKGGIERNDNPMLRWLVTLTDHFTESRMTDLVKSGRLC